MSGILSHGPKSIQLIFLSYKMRMGPRENLAMGIIGIPNRSTLAGWCVESVGDATVEANFPLIWS